jgi:hypothetical protein
MIAIAKKTQVSGSRKSRDTLEDNCQVLIIGYTNQAIRQTVEYAAARQDVHSALCGVGESLFRSWHVPNPCLAAKQVASEWFAAMQDGGFANCDKTLPFFPFGRLVFLGQCANYGRTAVRKRLTFI